MGKAKTGKGKGRMVSTQDSHQPRLADDMYDDVDKFHKDNDLRFETEMDNEDEDVDEEEEAAVMDLDDSDEADSDDDLEAGGQLAKSMYFNLPSSCLPLLCVFRPCSALCSVLQRRLRTRLPSS